MESYEIANFSNHIYSLNSVRTTLVITVHACATFYHIPNGILLLCDYIEKIRLHTALTFFQTIDAPISEQKINPQFLNKKDRIM